MIKMMARIFFQVFALLILFQAGDATLSATVNGQCDLCNLNNQLLEEVNDLKKEQSAIKGLIGQIIRPGEELLKLSKASIKQTIKQTSKQTKERTTCQRQKRKKNSSASPNLYKS